jgi:hypothetical protein
MNRRALPFAAAIVFATASASAARAQCAAPPATNSAPASAAAQDSAANPATPQSATKKVWTNEDVSGLDPHAGVSTVGNTPASSVKPGQKHPANSKNRDAKWYHAQIAKLQAKLPPLDAQIAELQAAIDGKPTGDAIKSTRPRGVKADSWANELADLQKKRDDAVAQIAALQDEARHQGVAANTLP